MKSLKLLCGLACLELFCCTAFAAHTPNHPAMSSDQLKTDGQAIAWVMALDQNEINAAKLVKTNNVNPDVKDFATSMIKDHSKNLKDVTMLSKKEKIKPVQTDMVKKLKSDGADMVANLKKLQGNDFQVAYINDMVQGHTDADNTINSDLMGSVTDSHLKDFLSSTDTVVKHHLEMAQKIQSELKQ